MKIKKLVLIIPVFVGSFLLLNKLTSSQDNNYIQVNLVNICGDYPYGFVKEDITNNPNYIFVKDPNFISKTLWNEQGNTVTINSFIECEHYVSGGWNYIPKSNYISNESDSCLIKFNLKDLINFDERIYIDDLKFTDFLLGNYLFCMGKVTNIKNENNQIYYSVLYSKSGYLFLSQAIPLLLFLLSIKFNSKIFYLTIVLYQIIIQLLFQYNFGLNIFNSIGLFQTLFMILIFNEINK